MPDLMSTAQVARYLGINEKKVYFLAKNGKIPCTRVTGKWTFPKKLIDRWIEESAAGLVGKKEKAEERSFLLAAGSDDPSLGLLHDLYEARTKPGSLFIGTVGSRSGLTAIREGIADFATAHLFDPATDEYNVPFIEELFPVSAVVVALFHRNLGLVLKPGNSKKITSIADLARAGIRMINRQAGSGTRYLFDHELARRGIDAKRISGYDSAVSTHLEVGTSVLRGDVDAGLATETTARLLGLEFIPLRRERFDLLIPKERFFSGGIQTLLGMIGTREFRERLEAIGGYDASESGRIVTAH
jgi:putative molybdopterin biosynthesis protein